MIIYRFVSFGLIDRLIPRFNSFIRMANNVHAADSSFLGFLFQIERVLLWLSEGGEGGKIGIETDDDIVVQLNNGNTIEQIYEQAKNAQTNRIPFSDQSEDLWKTLSIWVKAVQDGHVNVSTSIFSAITNKQISASRLIRKIAEAQKKDKANFDSVIKEIKEVATKISGKKASKNKKYTDVILNCDNAVLENVVEKVILLDGSFHHDQFQFKKKLKENLSMGDKLPLDHIYHALLGTITAKIIECWRKKEEAWLDVKSFNNAYNDLVAQYQRKSFIEKATELLPVSKNDIENNRNRTYVEQLKAINCEDNELLEAIHDYLRAQSEKSRYAKEFEVTESKFISYYDDLKNNWTNISRPRFKINAQNLSLEQIGYQVYYQSLEYKGKLNDHEPEQTYTYKGAYHYLANQPEIGWHPEWEKKFKTEKNGNK